MGRLRETLFDMGHWRFTFAETMGGISVAVLITLWANTTFQTKVEAQRERQELEKTQDELRANMEVRLQANELRVGTIERTMYGIRDDVSYIRGILTKGQRRE